jgi:RimJ/RimL family protein N-acetyltransferase
MVGEGPGPGEHAVPAGHVLLRDVTPDDLPLFFEFQLDPEANRMAAFAARDRDAFIAHWGRSLGTEAIDKQTIVCGGKVAGNIVCFEQEGQREVGYWLGREFWGQGIATQALAAFVNKVTARPLYGYVATHNFASRRVLEKCGFLVSGYDAAFTTLNGEDVAEIILKLDAGAAELVP